MKEDMKKQPFKGTDITWFPTPDFLTRSNLLASLSAPALRYLIFCFSEAGQQGSTSLLIVSQKAQTVAGLDRTSLPRARKELIAAGLIRVKSEGQGLDRVTLCEPLSKTPIRPLKVGEFEAIEDDNWGQFGE